MNESIFKRLGPVLVTGDQGFVGCHALDRWSGARGLSEFDNRINICNKAGLIECLREYQPGVVLHLAAISFVPDSFHSPETTFEVNFMGTLRLLEALAETGFTGRFLFIGTGDAYGMVPVDTLPVRENFVLRPRNPYAVSKVAAEALCYQWSQTGPFEVVMARPFNHIGVGQAPTFVISDFARQIAEVSAGLRPPVLHGGNIDVTRDFTDVKDVLRAYELLLSKGRNGEIYNVCSGVERSVRSLVERLLKLVGVEAEIQIDPTRFRSSDQPRVCGDHAKLSGDTGWQPAVSMDETLLSIYRYWKNSIGNSK
jgi:GDP-4-dehydro-6-deoxy-D-mannose reductase